MYLQSNHDNITTDQRTDGLKVPQANLIEWHCIWKKKKRSQLIVKKSGFEDYVLSLNKITSPHK